MSRSTTQVDTRTGTQKEIQRLSISIKVTKTARLKGKRVNLVEHYGCMCCLQHLSFGAKDNITVEAYIPACLNYRKQEAKQRRQTSISVAEHKTPTDAVRFS
jgi:hypothetical protein